MCSRSARFFLFLSFHAQERIFFSLGIHPHHIVSVLQLRALRQYQYGGSFFFVQLAVECVLNLCAAGKSYNLLWKGCLFCTAHPQIN